MRAAIVAILAIAAIVIAAWLMPTEDHERCEIPGHLRTSVVECETR
ncbi:hypothetical protein [Amycolatopsis thermoflava]|nr:hypothetical protein [Amycolatopsis thermoflava]